LAPLSKETGFLIRLNQACMMTISSILPDLWRLMDAAVAEDVGSGDITTLGCVPENAVMTAYLMARSPLVVAGLPWLEVFFSRVGANITVRVDVPEGSRVDAGTSLATLTGSARHILTYERIALNLLYVSCGIATTTRRYVQALEGFSTQLLDTRKTWPALRAVSKYAAHLGGAVNHRRGLYDGIMIKDNHRGFLQDVPATVAKLRQNHPHLPLIYECDTMDDVKTALGAGVDHLLLDNMSPEALRVAVAFVDQRATTEASGGITLKTLGIYAQTGVDYISTSAITMNPDAVDLGLDQS
jgi:nicotinate-nucleotide pyrophosphorylase (carboxylating)